MSPLAAPIFAILASAMLQSAGGPDPYEFEKARAAVLRAAVDRITPSIVTIETIGGAQPMTRGRRGPVEQRFKLADGPTTGLIISTDGLIITSSINFARDPSIITVILADGRRFVADMLGRDRIRRLALIKVDAEDLPAPEWTLHDEIRIGQYAIACGRGLGGDKPSVSMGIVSAADRRNGNAVQTDAKVSPTNYGGPLVDIEGRVLGVIVPMAGSGDALAGSQWYDSGIGFAIYKHKIDWVFDRLVAGETIEQGKIGIVLEPDEESIVPLLDQLLPQAKGVKIKQVANRSPAARAGLKPGDKVLAIDGQPTGDLLELLRRLSDRAAGEEITLTIKRRWRNFDVKLRLALPREIGRTPKSRSDDSEPPTDEPPDDADPDRETQPRPPSPDDD